MHVSRVCWSVAAHTAKVFMILLKAAQVRSGWLHFLQDVAALQQRAEAADRWAAAAQVRVRA